MNYQKIRTVCFSMLNDLIACGDSDDDSQAIKDRIIREVIEKLIPDNTMFGERACNFYDAIRAKHTEMRLGHVNDH